MKKSILFIPVILGVIGASVFAQNSLKDKLKSLQERENKSQQVVLDEPLRKELHDFLLQNEGVSVKNFRTFDHAYLAGMIYSEVE